MSLSGLTAREILPADGCRGALVGRVWRPDVAGPSVVAIRADADGAARALRRLHGTGADSGRHLAAGLALGVAQLPRSATHTARTGTSPGLRH